jgi:uncharacterized protein (TIGR03067 family)
MILAVCVLTGANAPKDDVDAVQGVWQLSSGEVAGKVLSEKQIKGGKLVVKDSHYSVVLADEGTLTGTQKLDSKQDPKTIDITDDSGPNKGKTCLGLYEQKGDEFRVVFAAHGKPRPSKFSTTAENGHWMHVWKRMKE